jgi:hypothetical protein
VLEIHRNTQFLHDHAPCGSDVFPSTCDIHFPFLVLVDIHPRATFSHNLLYRLAAFPNHRWNHGVGHVKNVGSEAIGKFNFAATAGGRTTSSGDRCRRLGAGWFCGVVPLFGIRERELRGCPWVW